MITVDKLPRLEITQAPDEDFPVMLRWVETIIVSRSIWQNPLILIALYIMFFAVTIFCLNSLLGWFGQGYNSKQLLEVRSAVLFVPSLIAAAFFSALTLNFVLFELTKDQPYTPVKEYPGYSYSRRTSRGIIHGEDGALKATFHTIHERLFRKNITVREEVVNLDEIQGFVLMSAPEYMGNQHFGPNVPIHNMIIADLGSGGTFPVCYHFGPKQEVAHLQARLMQAFVTERPGAPRLIIGADDPV